MWMVIQVHKHKDEKSKFPITSSRIRQTNPMKPPWPIWKLLNIEASTFSIERHSAVNCIISC